MSDSSVAEDTKTKSQTVLSADGLPLVVGAWVYIVHCDGNLGWISDEYIDNIDETSISFTAKYARGHVVCKIKDTVFVRYDDAYKELVKRMGLAT